MQRGGKPGVTAADDRNSHLAVRLERVGAGGFLRRALPERNLNAFSHRPADGKDGAYPWAMLVAPSRRGQYDSASFISETRPKAPHGPSQEIIRRHGRRGADTHPRDRDR